MTAIPEPALIVLGDGTPGSKLAKACGYVLGQWPTIMRIFDHGEVELDTNWAELERSGDGQPARKAAVQSGTAFDGRV